MKTAFRQATLRLPAMLIAFALAVGFAPTVLAENTVRVGVTGGERTAHASTVRFETARSSNGHLFEVGTATLTIDDSSGTNAGWQVTVSILSSEPAGTAPQVVVLGDLSLPRHAAGQRIDPRGGPFLPATPAPGDLRSPRTVLIAEPGFGKGTYQQELTVIRPLPAEPGDRRASVTLAVTITPRR